ncbi:hypothetical protein [Ferrimonas senticii]|uniref:hypothetical protein n=1 Tax=Ferrimonas senticii TaxID=394566 RepID=UPI0003F8761B|nr:hypothetical protein [Ferrimonas senticii]
MNMLLPGREPLPRIQALLSLTAIKSEAIIASLEDHYCRGVPLKSAAKINGADGSNARKASQQLETVATTVERIKEMDWAGFKGMQQCA